MQTNKLKTYAPKARRDFIAAVTRRAGLFGLSAERIAEAREEGELLVIDGQAHPRRIARQRARLAERIRAQGFEPVMEAAAYTWFNRLIAIRYMELHGFLDHSYRVLSHPAAVGASGAPPEILEQAQHVELPGLERERVIELKMDGTQDETLYRELLLAQCRALHQAMPFLFEPVDDETELLLPDRLLQTDSLIRELVSAIPEADWQPIEIIGWLYQFYISEKKDQVIGKVVKSEDIPAATQLFTPNWIVKYMVQNSLGAQWLATYPDSPLKAQMAYYIEPAEQTPEVQAQLEKMQREWLAEKAGGLGARGEDRGIRGEGLGASGDADDSALTPHPSPLTPNSYSLSPEHLTLMDPACGSGHILVEAYELFKAIYLERGYRLRDIPKLILEKNLYGLDIDPRAAQLAGFALMMKAREDDRRVLERGVTLNVMALEESGGLRSEEVKKLGSEEGIAEAVDELVELFRHARTFGSLIQVPEGLAEKLPALQQLSELTSHDLFVSEALKRLGPLVRQAGMLATQYQAVVANPPYMGGGNFCALLKNFVKARYEAGKGDLYGAFLLRNVLLTASAGRVGMITIPNWMSLSAYKNLRRAICRDAPIQQLVHNGRGVWGADFGSCSFVLQRSSPHAIRGTFLRLFSEHSKVATNDEIVRRFFEKPRFLCSNTNFAKIPGSPIAYWATTQVYTSFDRQKLNEIANPRIGIQSGDNESHYRQWFEVSSADRYLSFSEWTQTNTLRRCWVPLQQGGDRRKWYGNNDALVNLQNSGRDILNTHNASLRNQEHYFRESIVWNRVSNGRFFVRQVGSGYAFDDVSPFVQPKSGQSLCFLLGLLGSSAARYFLRFISTGMKTEVGHVASLPLPQKIGGQGELWREVWRLVEGGKADWNAYERSWDFQSLPLLEASCDRTAILESSYTAWITRNRDTIAEMKRLEEENNRLFIDAYGLQDELTPEVPIDQITLTVNPAYRYGWKGVREEGLGKRDEGPVKTMHPHPSPLTPEPSPLNPDPYEIPELAKRFREDTMQELVSYAIGCMMGRYRLDRPGLIYAHSGNEHFWTIYEGKDRNEELTPHPSPLTPPHPGVSEELPGLDRLAEGDGTGGASLPNDQDLSGRGTLRLEQSNSASGSLDTIEHRGGSCTSEQGRVSELPFDRPGIEGRGGNTDFDRPSAGLRDEPASRNDPLAADRTLEDAQRAATQTRPSSLTPRPFFPPDEDGILPITDTDWFEDDAANRVVEFIDVVWGEESQEVKKLRSEEADDPSAAPLTSSLPNFRTSSLLDQNLAFLAANLNPKKTESPRETIRRYLADKFFKDHLQTYKKRPIYWCFTSGKHKAFQCLVYLHRYHQGTLARMRMEYVVPLQSKMAARIDSLADDIEAASSGAQAKRLQKERDKLGKQLDELRRFDEQLRHHADQRIALDLDDGVKVNYGKFGDLLAEVKAVTGQKSA
ncbi:Type I restriction-modification system methyltransferase subunit [Thiorhodovibrio winogradskyi]|uniref:site-specific DNA-methyltransferase (adenine-specific) n=1 Tax=Thiorhodovibrio winogradskyi TaxID=77007 RepID=A0ABZ0SCL9_9GAMM